MYICKKTAKQFQSNAELKEWEANGCQEAKRHTRKRKPKTDAGKTQSEKGD